MRRSLDEDFSTDVYRAGTPDVKQPSESPLLNIIKLFHERLNEHRCPLYRAIKYNNLKDVQSLYSARKISNQKLFSGIFPKKPWIHQ